MAEINAEKRKNNENAQLNRPNRTMFLKYRFSIYLKSTGLFLCRKSSTEIVLGF